MEGLLFYWIFWLLWIFFTFIVNKQHTYRLKLSVAVLAVIIFADFHYPIAGFDLNMGGLLLLFLVYLSLDHEKTSKVIYFFISSFIVTIAYVAFHLFEIFDPVWIIVNKDWMIGICIGYLVILLQKKLKARLLIIISGMMQGEILFAYILSNYGFPYQVGSLECLDALALASLLQIGWSYIEYIALLFEGFINTVQKNKQKTS